MSERKPLLPPPSTSSAPGTSFLRTAALGASVVLAAVALIRSNKYILDEGRFPFPWVLVLCHMIFSFVSAAILLGLTPSLFPSITDPAKSAELDVAAILKRMMPIAVFFAGHMVLSNVAYMYASVAFLQM